MALAPFGKHKRSFGGICAGQTRGCETQSGWERALPAKLSLTGSHYNQPHDHHASGGERAWDGEAGGAHTVCRLDIRAYASTACPAELVSEVGVEHTISGL